jgi:hypothetical protein
MNVMTTAELGERGGGGWEGGQGEGTQCEEGHRSMTVEMKVSSYTHRGK